MICGGSARTGKEAFAMRMFLTTLGIAALGFSVGCETQPVEPGDEVVVSEVPVETGFAEVEGGRLYYEVSGSGEPVVLIHGCLSDCRVWDQQFGTFAKNYQVIRYDVRGYGKSSLPEEGEPYSHADDLAALLETIGIDKAHIIGWSMGAGIAFDFVLTRPEMSRSLAVAGPWPLGYNSGATAWAAEAFKEAASILEEEGKQAASDYLMGLPPVIRAFPNQEVLKRLGEIARDYSFWHLTHEDPVTYLDPPAVERLDQISVPTLVVTAEHDFQASREIADALNDKLATALRAVMGRAGHAMFMDDPDTFNGIVLTFLAGASSQQGT